MSLISLFTDGYKTFHQSAMHEDIVRGYGNFINRSGKYSNLPDDSLGGVVYLGGQYLCKDVFAKWDTEFFQVDKGIIIGEMKRYLDAYLGRDYDMSHFEDLHDLGYLPIEFKSVPEGTIVPYGVASFSIKTTVDGYEWVYLFLETIISTQIWPMSTSATTAAYYMKQSKALFKAAGLPNDMLPFINHNFSMRGMFGKEAGAMGDFGHLSAGHCGTDTLPGIMFAEDFYNANVEKELVGCSVNATEHSIKTSFIMIYAKQNNVSLFEAEVAYVRMLIKRNQTGVLSDVADSFDFWKFVTEGLPLLKDEIMARDGCYVVRPDTGIPEDILCGDENAEAGSPQHKGLIEILAAIFGTTLNEYGIEILDSHIGAIYGDSITPQRQATISERLMKKGFSPAVVLGIGSRSYQLVTRDTHGSAIKCTAAYLKDGSVVDVCKDPKTDPGKKSAKGLLRLERENGVIVQYEQQTIEQEKQGLLETVYLDGELVKETSLVEIRKLLASQL